MTGKVSLRSRAGHSGSRVRPLARNRGACAVGLALGLLITVSLSAQDSLYRYTTRRDRLTLPDGTGLAVTWWLPTAKHPDERFPALLELPPYRKDDSFYVRDFPLYDYFVRRGFLMVKADVRRTGGSSGPLPPREYSDAELSDAVEIIARLARHSLRFEQPRCHRHPETLERRSRRARETVARSHPPHPSIETGRAPTLWRLLLPGFPEYNCPTA